jgi:hypothetical protein
MDDDAEHEAVQEALAARALGVQDDTDRAAADDLIHAHLQSCSECAAALEDFETIAGELALLAPSLRPPATLDARVHRALSDRRMPGRAGMIAAAAVVVALAFGLWSAHATGRMSRAEEQRARAAEMISAVAVPESRVVRLMTHARAGAAQVAAVYAPRRGHLYLVGSMPDPSSDRVYQLWLGRDGLFASGGTFVPDRSGFVLVRVPAGGAAYDHVLITEESPNGGNHPSDSRIAESDL